VAPCPLFFYLSIDGLRGVRYKATVFVVELYSFSKSASIDPASRRECEEIMSEIFKENPSYWPYGLSIKGHQSADHADVYMIREASSRRPVGFTGWQEFQERSVPGNETSPLIKVGYYSIGILHEYRGHGLAKAAVARLLREKAASVDEVRAFIMPHNKPSIELAARLGVPVVHG